MLLPLKQLQATTQHNKPRINNNPSFRPHCKTLSPKPLCILQIWVVVVSHLFSKSSEATLICQELHKPMDCQSLEGASTEDHFLSLWEELGNNPAASTKESLKVAVSKDLLTVAL